jgi:hypothetical protein
VVRKGGDALAILSGGTRSSSSRRKEEEDLSAAAAHLSIPASLITSWLASS